MFSAVFLRAVIPPCPPKVSRFSILFSQKLKLPLPISQGKILSLFVFLKSGFLPFLFLKTEVHILYFSNSWSSSSVFPRIGSLILLCPEGWKLISLSHQGLDVHPHILLGLWMPYSILLSSGNFPICSTEGWYFILLFFWKTGHFFFLSFWGQGVLPFLLQPLVVLSFTILKCCSPLYYPKTRSFPSFLWVMGVPVCFLLSPGGLSIYSHKSWVAPLFFWGLKYAILVLLRTWCIHFCYLEGWDTPTLSSSELCVLPYCPWDLGIF